MPRLIKKYSNRRMYDTSTSRPITLSELAELIKQGEEIQVIGHPAGRDLTSITLIQVLLGQEKNKREFFSALMRELIKKREDSVSGLYPMSLSVTSSGTFSSIEKARAMITELVNERRVSKTEGERLLRSFAMNIQENRKALEKEIDDKLKKRMQEVKSLYQKQILELRKNVENLREQVIRRQKQRSVPKDRFTQNFAKRRS